jgi:hypothetical protein
MENLKELKMPKLRLRKSKDKSETKWTSHCGRRRNRDNLNGSRSGETVVLVGILSVPLWPPTSSVAIWTFTQEVLT